MGELAPVRTPLAPAAAEELLRASWVAKFGEPPPNAVIRNLLAIWDLETDVGRAMFHHNYGNILQTNPDADYFVLNDSGNLRRFRPYRSALDGARGLVDQLTSPSRPNYEDGLRSKTPERFARRLKGTGAEHSYYETTVARYTPRLRAGWNRYAHIRVQSGGGVGLALAAAAAAAAALYLARRRSRGLR